MVENPKSRKRDKPRRREAPTRTSSSSTVETVQQEESASSSSTGDASSFSGMAGRAMTGTANFLSAPLETISQLPSIDFSFVLRGVSSITSNLILRSFNFRHTIFDVLRRSIGFQRPGILGRSPIGSRPFNSMEQDAEKIELDDDTTQPQSSTSELLSSEVKIALEEASVVLNETSTFPVEEEMIRSHLTKNSKSLKRLTRGKISSEKLLGQICEQIAQLEKQREEIVNTTLLINSAHLKAQSNQNQLEENLKQVHITTDNSDTTVNEEAVSIKPELNGPSVVEASEPVTTEAPLEQDEAVVPPDSSATVCEEPQEPKEITPKVPQPQEPSEIPSKVSQPKSSTAVPSEVSQLPVAVEVAPVEPQIGIIPENIEEPRPKFPTSQEWQAHHHTVTSISKDHNGPLLASSSSEGEIKLWCVDPSIGEYTLQSTIDSQHGSIHCLKILDSILATGGQDNKISVFNARNLLPSTRDTDSLTVDSFDVEPNSPLLAPISDSSSSRFSVSSTLELGPSVLNPSIVLKGHTGAVRCLDMDEQHIVSGSHDGTIRQWDIENGKQVSLLDLSWFMNKDAEKAYRIQYWDTLSGRGSHVEALGSSVGALQFHGRALCSGSADGIIRLWDLRSGQMHHSLAGHTGPITCLSLSSSLVISGSLDHTIRIWDLRTRKSVEQFKYPGGIIAAQFDAQRVVVSCETKPLHLYEFMTFQSRQLLGHRQPSWSLYLDSESHLFSGDQGGMIRLSTL